MKGRASMTTRQAHARSAAGEPARPRFGDRYVITADRIFDGTRVLEHHAVAVSGDRIAAVAPADRLSGQGQLIRFAGTLLPGFIDLHGHPLLGQVPPDKILRHGLTRSEEHTSELQSRRDLVCRLLLEKKKN